MVIPAPKSAEASVVSSGMPRFSRDCPVAGAGRSGCVGREVLRVAEDEAGQVGLLDAVRSRRHLLEPEQADDRVGRAGAELGADDEDEREAGEDGKDADDVGHGRSPYAL